MSTELFVAFCNDRHTDPVIRVFSSPDRAVEFARKFMRDNMAQPEHIVEKENQGSVFYSARYLEQGDYAYVERITLDDEAY